MDRGGKFRDGERVGKGLNADLDGFANLMTQFRVGMELLKAIGVDI